MPIRPTRLMFDPTPRTPRTPRTTRRTAHRTTRLCLNAVVVAALAACGTGKEEEPGGSARIASSACTSTPALFTSTVWKSFEETCTACHTAGGLGNGSGLVFPGGTDLLANYNTLRDYALAKPTTLLSKTIGEPNHGGAKPFVDANSQRYKDLQTLIPQMTAQTCATASTGGGGAAAGPGGFWKGVQMASDTNVLAKSAVLFAGRNPTAAELTAVNQGGEAALRQTIRSHMQGPAFDRFLEDVGDTHFLTPGVIVRGTGGYNATDWPSAGAVLGANGVTQEPQAVRTRFEASVRREGTELMKYIVRNDRPYTEVVTANYTVMNGVMARFMGATVQGNFVNADDDTEWRPATLADQRLGGMREHSGVLSTQAWLSRFPTTDTNRNRHRVNMLMKQFLGTDATALAMRPAEGAGTTRVPTVENPACSACHSTIDPMAAGFQNWNEANRFLPVRTNNIDHALPQSYRSNNYPRDANNMAYFRSGDNWFRDGHAPGYGATVMPGGFTGNKTALQFLGQQVAMDPRFAMGAVHFWYEGLYGRDPLPQPQDSTSPQYAAQLAAYTAQNDEFKAIAARFATNQGRGAYNVKDLLVDLIMSPLGRAERVADPGGARAGELADIGSQTMLSPAALNRKLMGVVGLGWADFNNPYTGFALNYGDFDGLGRNKRAQSHTMMQTITVDRMVAVRSCTFAQNDFNKAVGDRLLFPLVAMADTPATATGLANITANVRHLHKWLWKDDVPESDAEVQRTLKLFTDTWADRATAPARPVNCAYNANNDPNYTGRAWAAVLAYMLGDVKFLYE